MTQRTIRLPQGDDVTISVGPIPSATGGYYDATGATAELLIKDRRGASDTTATTVAGAMSGNTTSGFVATFRLPRTLTTGVAARRWYRARLVTATADRRTIGSGPLLIDPM